MNRSPEDVERMRKLAIRGAALAAAGLALRHRRIIGDWISSAEIWEKSESIVLDRISTGKEKTVRMFAGIIRDDKNQIVDVSDVQLVNDDGTDAQISQLEHAFPESDDSAK